MATFYVNESVPTKNKVDNVKFAGGTQRNSKKPRYDLITPTLLRRVAATMQEGALKYGESNWKKSINDKVFVIDCFNHAIEHLYSALEYPPTEDHLAHAVCNIMFLMESQKNIQEKTNDDNQ